MRIIAGGYKGKTLQAPAGQATRPTADRVRQTIFDMLLHAPWAGRDAVEGALVLDAFAGTGALGLEALSRGAAHATFFENDRAALAALRANIAACGVLAHATVCASDVLRPGPGRPQGLIFLDPPYGHGFLQLSVNVLRAEGWLSRGSLVVAEAGRLESVVEMGSILAHRVHGAAQIIVWRE
jgi:16S rRNA (guanine966-N2)-methyltransferase